MSGAIRASFLLQRLGQHGVLGHVTCWIWRAVVDMWFPAPNRQCPCSTVCMYRSWLRSNRPPPAQLFPRIYHPRIPPAHPSHHVIPSLPIPPVTFLPSISFCQFGVFSSLHLALLFFLFIAGGSFFSRFCFILSQQHSQRRETQSVPDRLLSLALATPATPTRLINPGTPSLATASPPVHLSFSHHMASH